jgi:hypothetical protein
MTSSEYSRPGSMRCGALTTGFGATRLLGDRVRERYGAGWSS